MAESAAARLTAAEGRRFALTVGAAFLALGGLLTWRGRPMLAIATGSIGVALIVAGLVVPARLGPVHRAWMGLALLLSKVTTPLVMGVLYFAVLAPSGLLMRVFGRNPIRRRRDSPSYWVARESRRSDLTRQF